MEWGLYAKQLEKIAKKGKFVQALQKRPELFNDLNPIWQAFQRLHSSRHSGDGVNPLATSDIVLYLNFLKIDDVASYDLILAMDNEWCKWALDKNKQERENRKKKGCK